MKIFATIAGFILTIISFVYMITLIVTAPAPDSTGFFTAVLCSNDEIMTRTIGERFDNGYFKINKVPHRLYCQDRNGVMREVTEQAFAVVMGGYLVLFLTGLFSMIFGSLSLTREKMLALETAGVKAKRQPKILI